MRAIAAAAAARIARQFTGCGAPEMVRDRDVLGDGEVGEQRQVLVDDLDAASG